MELETLDLRHRKIGMQMNTLMAAADKDQKGVLTDEQNTQLTAWETEQKSLESQMKNLKTANEFTEKLHEQLGLTGGEGARLLVSRAGETKSFGQLVIEHKGFKDLLEVAKRSRRFESDLIEVKAAPILDDGLVPAAPLGRIAPGPSKRLVVAGLFAQGTTIANSVTYNREASFTNAAAAVSEGTAKPESEIVLTPIVEPVRKYAHWITVSKEALEDIQGIRSYIDGRLRYGLALTIDNALLNGSATPPSLVGMLNRSGLSATVVQGTGESVADAILKQAAAVEVTSGLPADGVVLHPNDWLRILASKDTSGQYYGNGPFAAPAPNGPTLWGELSVAVSALIAENTALVGAFRTGAQLLWRETMAVSISNSHASYFVQNLLAILIEARLALVVTMPEAFGKVTLTPVTP